MKTPDDIKKGLIHCTQADKDCNGCPYDPLCFRGDLTILEKHALAYIQQLEAKAPKWNSVEERLPRELQYVLAFKKYDDDSFEPCIAYVSANEWFTGTFASGCEITHWMPLPEPPEV